MARVVFIGLEEAAASQIGSALSGLRHEITCREQDTVMRDLVEADIVFAGGDSAEYLSLLRRVRAARPGLPFVVVTRLPEVVQWLDALEAGATDYCAAPIDMQQVQWVMESALLGGKTAFDSTAVC
jgi:DNA-binding NtrC family response regulator